MCMAWVILVMCGCACIDTVGSVQSYDYCDYQVLAEWSNLELSLPSNIKQSVDEFEPKHNLISSVRRFGDILYISIPRWKSGVVSTLTSLDLTQPRLPSQSPQLSPFPSLALNKIGHCQALQNVDGIEIDPTGRLWIADSGQTAPFSNPDRKCPPKLIVWDLNTNQELVHHLLPSSGQPLFKQIVVDLSYGLQNSFAYISDFNSGTIFVYSLSTNTSWTLQTAETRPANNVWNLGQFQPFYLRAGVYGLALISDGQTESENQLLASRLSEDLFTCPVSDLQLKEVDISEGLESFGLDKPGHAGGLAGTVGGEVYLVTLDTSEVYFFNMTEPESGWTQLCQLPQKYSWVDSPNFDQDGNLILVSNRFHEFTRDKIEISGEPIFTVIKIPLGHQNYMTRFAQYSSTATRISSASIIMIFTVILLFLDSKKITVHLLYD